MKLYRIILPILAAAVSCGRILPEEAVVPSRENVSSEVPAESGAVAVVQFDDDMVAVLEGAASPVETKSAGWNALAREIGITEMERIFPEGEFESRTREMGLHRFYRVSFSEDNPGTRAQLGSADGIIGTEKVRKIRLRTQNDPLWSYQWSLYNDGTRAGYMAGVDINVVPVWEKYTAGSRYVTVAVVDDGVDLSHQDLAANAIAPGPEGSWNFCSKSADIVPSTHATHVAGIIAAVRNNGLGISGVAGGNAASGADGVRIMNCQVFQGDDVATDISTANAIKWGADKGAVICQNSWGYYADEDENGVITSEELKSYKSMGIPDFLQIAIDYFIKYAGCDASGRQRQDSPMKGGIVIFAAGNENIDYDPVCNYGPVISVGAFNAAGRKAPYSNYGDWVDISAPGGDFSSDMGIYSLVPGNGYTRYQGTSMACPHVSGAAALLLSHFGGPGFTPTDLRRLLLEGADVNILKDKNIGPKLDVFGSFSQGDPTDEYDPVIETSYDGSYVFRQYENPSIDFRIHDPDGHRVSVATWTDGDATLSYDSVSGICTFSIVGRDVTDFKEKTATITATDTHGRSATVTLKYRVIKNSAPRLVSRPSGILAYLGDGATEIDLSPCAVDDDGEIPEWKLMGQPVSVAHINLSSDGRLSVTPLSAGRELVSVTAFDVLSSSEDLVMPLVVREKGVLADIVFNREDLLLSVATGEQMLPARVRVYSATGSLVADKTEDSDAFTPIYIDLSKAAPGRYNIRVDTDGKTFSRQIARF